jgi:uncharacterized membrane protein HdeD (DUF308 family)
MTALPERRVRTSTLMVVMVRGVLALVLGLATVGLWVLAVLFPRVTTSVLVLLFGAYAALDGVLTLALCSRADPAYRAPLGLQGVISLCAGVAALAGMIALGPRLLYLIAFWGIAAGVLEFIVGRRVRQQFGIRAIAVSGIASILFGAAVLIAWPGAGLVPFMWLLAAYAILVGIARIVAAAR